MMGYKGSCLFLTSQQPPSALVAAGKVDCSGVPWKLRCPRPIRKMLSMKAWTIEAKGWRWTHQVFRVTLSIWLVDKTLVDWNDPVSCYQVSESWQSESIFLTLAILIIFLNLMVWHVTKHRRFSIRAAPEQRVTWNNHIAWWKNGANLPNNKLETFLPHAAVL